jgi:hypothetical protein
MCSPYSGREAFARDSGEILACLRVFARDARISQWHFNKNASNNLRCAPYRYPIWDCTMLDIEQLLLGARASSPACRA